MLEVSLQPLLAKLGWATTTDPTFEGLSRNMMVDGWISIENTQKNKNDKTICFCMPVNAEVVEVPLEGVQVSMSDMRLQRMLQR